MGKAKHTVTLLRTASALLMLLALAWLTVCLPYVNEDRQAAKIQMEQGAEDTGADNPLNNTNEEKSESGSSLPSEYLHEAHGIEHNFITLPSFFKCHPSDLYHAYHPDLLIPPPDRA